MKVGGLKECYCRFHYIKAYFLYPTFLYLRTLGGTPNRDPCSLWGLIWGLPRDIGVI